MRRSAAVAIFLAACTPDGALAPEPGAPRAVLDAPGLTLVRDPGPTPNDESPPIHTLYSKVGNETRAVARVLDVAQGGSLLVEADGTLRAGPGGPILDTNVRPGLSTAPDGRVAYVKSAGAAATDVFWVEPGGRPVRVTRDGRSERPFFLPDGRLLHTSSGSAADGDPQAGKVGWFEGGRRLNAFPAARVPAFPDRTRWDAARRRVVFDAGDGLYTLDPATGATEPLK